MLDAFNLGGITSIVSALSGQVDSKKDSHHHGLASVAVRAPAPYPKVAEQRHAKAPDTSPGLNDAPFPSVAKRRHLVAPDASPKIRRSMIPQSTSDDRTVVLTFHAPPKSNHDQIGSVARFALDLSPLKELGRSLTDTGGTLWNFRETRKCGNWLQPAETRSSLSDITPIRHSGMVGYFRFCRFNGLNQYEL